MQITPEATVTFRLDADPDEAKPAWVSALPDALAFALGLAVARWAGWSSGDLIWSLWLSSLVVGYATIVWIIGQPAAALAALAWRTRNDPNCSPRTMLVFWALILVGAGFLLAFFTVHFGGFHYVHSSILLSFFPIDAPGVAHANWPSRAIYAEIFRRYWVFLPAAFLSHRAAFLRKPLVLDGGQSLKSFARSGVKNRDFFAEPYRNVMRMHGLIFFFFLAHFAGLENFAVYAVIYAVYFFPWRLVRNDGVST
jgi:hypothetical protein